MENIHKHIYHNKKMLDDSMMSPQTRRHIEEELESLEKYAKNHPENDNDPTPLELYCDANPEALECRIYEN
jgi:hypothetical protein